LRHSVLLLHPFNGLFSRTTLVSQHQILLEQKMMGWQWHQLDHMQIIWTPLQTDNHASTSPLSFYGPDVLPATQPTASKHRRHNATTRTHKNHFIAINFPKTRINLLHIIRNSSPVVRTSTITFVWWPHATNNTQKPNSKLCQQPCNKLTATVSLPSNLKLKYFTNVRSYYSPPIQTALENNKIHNY